MKIRVPIVGSGSYQDPFKPKYFAKKAKNQAYDLVTMTVVIEVSKLTSKEQKQLEELIESGEVEVIEQ